MDGTGFRLQSSGCGVHRSKLFGAFRESSECPKGRYINSAVAAYHHCARLWAASAGALEWLPAGRRSHCNNRKPTL
eukprot:1057877-Prorocentrum_minimum.AAC.3